MTKKTKLPTHETRIIPGLSSLGERCMAVAGAVAGLSSILMPAARQLQLRFRSLNRLARKARLLRLSREHLSPPPAHPDTAGTWIILVDGPAKTPESYRHLGWGTLFSFWDEFGLSGGCVFCAVTVLIFGMIERFNSL